MNDPRGPEDELRALYRHLQPQQPSDELPGTDAETRRAVGWMQGAWRELEPPPAVVPILRPPRARGLHFARRAARVAAAILLFFTSALLLRSLAGLGELPPPVPVAKGPSNAPAQDRVTSPAQIVEVLDVRPDRVELRSGRVRLVLLDPPPPLPEPAGS